MSPVKYWIAESICTRFTCLQKKLVLNEFMMGEETGKKMTSEKPALKMRSIEAQQAKYYFRVKLTRRPNICIICMVFNR